MPPKRTLDLQVFIDAVVQAFAANTRFREVTKIGFLSQEGNVFELHRGKIPHAMEGSGRRNSPRLLEWRQ